MRKIIWMIGVLGLWQMGLFAQQPGTGGRGTYGGGAPAGTYTISGKIQDATTKVPLEYATVSVYSSADSSLATGSITDEKGNFNVELKKAGDYYIIVSFLGYVNQALPTTTLTEAIPKATLGTIMLKNDAQALGEVEIVAEQSQMQMQLDKKVFNVGKDLSTAGTNAVDVLDNIPSVEVDVDGNVSLRGSGNVQIFIDGKPSGLSGPNALKFLQADQIDRIEIVTNPSARYSAEGEVGIINIILKKDRKQGLTGSVTLNTGWPHNHGGGISLNYRTKAVNLFASYSLNYRSNPGKGFYRQEFYGDTLRLLEADRKHTRAGLGNTLRLGSDFFWKDFNTFTVSGSYRYSVDNNSSSIVYRDFNTLREVIASSDRVEKEHDINNNYEAELNYRRTFKKKGQEFVAIAKWIYSTDDEKSDITESVLFGAADNLFQRSNNKEIQSNWLFQTDYVHPLPKGLKFETGARITLRTIKNDYSVEELDNGEWTDLSGFVDSFSYLENIYAAYGILSGQHKKFSWQGGLRTELSDITVISEAQNSRNNKLYAGLFPSVHLSYKFNDLNTVQLSYSRRLSRPNFRNLLPFSSYSDARNFRAGNPDLNPEYTNSFEIGYLRYWKSGSLLSSAYYRYRTGVVTRITQVDEQGFATNFPVNLGEEHSVGLELTVSQTLWKIWTLSGGANFYYFQAIGSYQGQNLNANSLAGNMRLTSKWALPKDISIQAAGTYRSPQQRSQGRSLYMASLDLSASKEIFKKKGTVSINVRDVFNSRKFRSETTTADFTRYDEFQWATRQIILTFSYRFGTQTKQQKRNSAPSDGGGGMDEY